MRSTPVFVRKKSRHPGLNVSYNRACEARVCGCKRLLRKTDAAVGDRHPHGTCGERICFDCTYRPECKADACRGAPPVRSAFPAGRSPFFGKTRRVCACDESGLRITVYRIFSSLTVMPEMLPPPGFFFGKIIKISCFVLPFAPAFRRTELSGTSEPKVLRDSFFSDKSLLAESTESGPPGGRQKAGLHSGICPSGVWYDAMRYRLAP